MKSFETIDVMFHTIHTLSGIHMGGGWVSTTSPHWYFIY